MSTRIESKGTQLTETTLTPTLIRDRVIIGLGLLNVLADGTLFQAKFRYDTRAIVSPH